MNSLTGSMILQYRIEEKIGQGGMGEVYLAEDTRLRRQVALKFLPDSHQADPDRRARLLQEARAMSSLRSPNIVATYDFGEFEGTVFLVMEYIAGDTLAKKIEGGPLSVLETIDIGMQVADALDEAHGRGIIHRDIKSENLIITDRGLVKILDFGLAKFVDRTGPGEDQHRVTMTLGPQTMAGMVLGSGSYMSPEQALGREIDHRTDIFSLGVVIYNMLTARLPFEGNTITEIIDHIVHHTPPAVARFNYEVPEPLDNLVRKALEKDANFRYQTARDMYIDLTNVRRAVTGDQPDAARTGEVRSDRPRTDAMMRPTDAPEIAASSLDDAVAVLPFVNITKNEADGWIGDGIAETVASDLKSKHGLKLVGRERVVEAAQGLELKDAEADEKFTTAVGRRLGIAWIVAGAYQRIENVIRVTARFVDVQTGGVLKTVKIDGETSEIFQLQDRIAQELMDGVDLHLTDSGSTPTPPTAPATAPAA